MMRAEFLSLASTTAPQTYPSDGLSPTSDTTRVISKAQIQVIKTVKWYLGSFINCVGVWIKYVRWNERSWKSLRSAISAKSLSMVYVIPYLMFFLYRLFQRGVRSTAYQLH